MELILREGCTDSIVGIKTMLEWSESERQYKQQYKDLLTQFHDFELKVAEVKNVTYAGVAGWQER